MHKLGLGWKVCFQRKVYANTWMWKKGGSGSIWTNCSDASGWKSGLGGAGLGSQVPTVRSSRCHACSQSSWSCGEHWCSGGND